MTDDRLDRAISDTLSDLAMGSSTAYIEDVLARTARTRQRPTWTFPGRYLNMTPVLKFATVTVLAAAASIGVASILAQPTYDVPGQTTCPEPGASMPPAASSAPGSTPGPVVIGDCEPWVAYVWSKTEAHDGINTIKAVRPDGTGAHVVVSAGSEALDHADWSHDGQRLAFDHWQGDLIDIWTANADGSAVGPLVGCELPCKQLSNPAWSPDDSHLLVARSDDTSGPEEQCFLEVIDIETLARRVILEGPIGSADILEWQCYAQPRWSSDGSTVVFTVDQWEQNNGEWTLIGRAVATIAAEGPSSQQPSILTDPALLATHPDWHPADDVIVFGTRDLSDFQGVWLATNLYTVRADGTDLRQLTTFADGEAKATWPTWTPDGSGISFTYVEPRGAAGVRRLATIRPDGSDLQVVPGISGNVGRLRPLP